MITEVSARRHVHYSIVIPVYCNEGCLLPLFRSLAADVLEANPELSGELVFVDDGSEDRSFEELDQIRRASPANVTIIRLTRNFGQAGALLAGYEHAAGDCVITISADGQEPPALLNEMLRGFFDEHYEIVACARSGRDESLYRIATSRVYYSLMRRLAFKNMPTGGFDVWLMSRRVLEVFLRNSDANPSFPGRLLWMGFKIKFISYRRRARLVGISRSTLAKKFDAFLDGIMAYSFAPLRAMWSLGCGVALLGLAGAALVGSGRLFLDVVVDPWSVVLIVLLIVSGLQMTMIGVVGEYVWRTLAQVRNRDRYVIDAVHGPADPP